MSSIDSFYPKLGRIAANQQALAESLNRAAAALRSIGTARKTEAFIPEKLAQEPGVQ